MNEVAFQYHAIDRDGKTVRGRVVAACESDATRKLRSSGLTPTEIRSGRAPRKRASFRGITLSEVAALTRELSVLVDANLPVAKGLGGVAAQDTSPALAEVSHNIASRIESGDSISSAFAAHPRTFDRVYVQTIRAAEASGRLAPVLGHLAEMLDERVAASQALRRALSYPVVVLGFVSLALIVLLTFVIPRFSDTFAAGGVDLPWITQVVQALGGSMQSQWYFYLAGAASLVYALMAMWKSPSGRLVYERLFLRIPHVRGMLVAACMARFSRVLAISLESGVGLVESIELAGSASGRPLFEEYTRDVARRMRGGARIDEALTRSPYVPGFARRMLSSGSDAKELGRAALIVAEHFDRETKHLSKSVNTLVEPLLTVALSSVVLLVSLSVFLPMWQMVRVNR